MNYVAIPGGTEHAQWSPSKVDLIQFTSLSSSSDLTDSPSTFRLEISYTTKYQLKMGLSCNLNNREFSSSIRRSDIVTEVVSGRYPMEKITKMNSPKLRQLVLRLVEFTAAEAGTSKQSKPVWWPRNMTFHCILDLDGTSTKEHVQQVRSHLQFLILSCCKFFRKCRHNLQLCHGTWINDENYNSKKRTKSPAAELPSKRRRTLVCQNTPEEGKESVVVAKSKRKAVQSDFLNSFQLEVTDSASSIRSKLPTSLRSLKIHNCPHIPLSSDVGRTIMFQENYSVPEYVIVRKLERLEWYVNKDIPRVIDRKFEISYVSPKNNKNSTHIYKFPIRQFHQIHGNIEYKQMLLKACRPLQVVVMNEDLLAKKWNLMNVSITVPKLSSNIVSRYLPTKKMCNDTKTGNIDS